MVRGTLLFAILLFCAAAFTQSAYKVYLISGQGSDERIFKNIRFDSIIDTEYISYSTPLENETIRDYAERLSTQIDTTQAFSIVGVSLGGMIACEMTDFIHPDKVIIISSASSSDEIPAMYKFFRNHDFYKSIDPGIFKYSTFILQPLYENDRKLERATCNSMIRNKDAEFMKNAVSMIVLWERKPEDNSGKNIVHIHGDDDHTIPIEHIKADYIIQGGSHMMTLTRAEEISAIIQKELLNLEKQ